MTALAGQEIVAVSEKIRVTNKISQKLRTRGILSYLVLSFGISWSIWTSFWLLRIPVASEIGQLGPLFGAFGPAIAAIVVRSVVTREGYVDAGLSPRLRSGWHYYLFSIVWPFGIIAALAGLLVAVGTALPQLAPAAVGLNAIGGVSGWTSALIGTLIYTPLIWGEEFGWRGYLQIRLFNERPLQAALATGLIWGVWHWAALLTGQIPNQNGLLSMILFPWYTVWLSIVLGWLRLRSGTIWTASLAHSANNFILNASQVGLLLSFNGGLGDLLLSPRGVLIAIPVTILCLSITFTGRLGPLRPRAEETIKLVEVVPAQHVTSEEFTGSKIGTIYHHQTRYYSTYQNYVTSTPPRHRANVWNLGI